MWIFNIIQLAIILAVSIWMHEYAHAYVSYSLGDPTPKLQWRLTPNPLKHIDPIGFLMIFLAHFGRGKPVQINPLYYKNPRKGELMVALAWPATNLILAILGIFVMLIYAKVMWWTPNDIYLNTNDIMISFWKNFTWLNIALAIFNLIPVPPLDGSKLLFSILPNQYSRTRQMLESYSFILVLIVVFFLWQIIMPVIPWIFRLVTGVGM